MNKINFKDHRKANDKSSVWFYYLYSEKEMLARCKQCSKVIKVAGGSTSGLHKHLKTHEINLLKRKEPAAASNSNTTCTGPPVVYTDKCKITNFFPSNNDNSLSAVLARMTALDGLTFKVFCTSHDLRKALIARGFNEIPKSPNTIKNIVVNYSQKIRSSLIKNFAELKINGKRFSLTFDEWTSVRNRRYLNINLHTEKQFWNLGITRVSGTMPGEKCVEIIENKLKDYGLSLRKDIVSITTDGASVMKKLAG
jgi:hypothetical protein